MKNNIIFSLVSILLFAGLYSCQDYLVETNPNGSDADSYWKNLDQTNQTIMATYATLLNKNVISIREEAWRSDLAVPGYGRPDWVEPGGPWYFQNFNDQDMPRNRWETLYNGIFRANQVIEALVKLKGAVNEDDRTRQLGEARFLRGLYHFYLHCSYNKGSIIIKDKVPGSVDDFKAGLSTSEEVLDFIREDLRFAYNNLPISYDEANTGRVTKGTAATILGNSYLYNSTVGDPNAINQTAIDSAIVYYESVIESGAYKLVDDMSLLFTNAGEFNEESIFEINYSEEVRTDINQWTNDAFVNQWASYATNFGHSQAYYPSLWLSYEYMHEPLDTKHADNYVTNEYGTTFLRPVSKRASAMVALAIDTVTEYYKEVAITKSAFNDENSVARFKHYTNHDVVEKESENKFGAWASGKNVTINRLGEIYINLAECYVHKDNVTKALELINTVRKRWGLQLIGSALDTDHDYNGIIYDKAALLERIQLIEKPLETSIEGYSTRWIDLRRWGITKSNFEKRALEKYWADVVVYEGKNYWANTIIKEDPNDPNQPLFTDYELAAQNFDYESDAWFAVPNSEISTNPELNN